MISYKLGNELDLAQVVDLYRASTLGDRRPIDDLARMAGMIHHANLVVTAWDGPLLVGISRCLSDFHYVTYCSDLAVRASHQCRGIGRELLRLTQKHSGTQAALILLSAPAAVDYYPRVGFTRHPQAWVLPPGASLR